MTRKGNRLTNAHNITPINCHTLFGEGACYAPDLTKIAQHRGGNR